MKIFKAAMIVAIAMSTHHIHSMEQIKRVIEGEMPFTSNKKSKVTPAELVTYLDKIKPLLPRTLKGSTAKREPKRMEGLVKPKAERKLLTLVDLYRFVAPGFLGVIPVPKMLPNALSPRSCFESTALDKRLEKALIEGNFEWFFAILAKYSHDEQKRWCNTAFGEKLKMPLHYAAYNGKVEAIAGLIKEFGAKVDAQDKLGFNPLHYAAANGQIGAIASLIKDFGAKVEAQAKIGSTALHTAAKAGHVGVIISLIKDFGAKVDAQDIKGQTPLHVAASHGQAGAIAILIKDFGAQIEAQTKAFGCTALHAAAVNGQVGAIASLIKDFGAKIDAQTNDGWTPLDFAIHRGHREALKALLALGAELMPTLTKKHGPLLAQNQEMLAFLKNCLKESPGLEKFKDICCICHDLFIEAANDVDKLDFNKIVRTACCKKIIHRECLANSLLRNPLCPLCKQANPQ